SDMRVHFGLGSAVKIDELKIRWPSGVVERFDNLRIDTIHSLKEGTGTAVQDTEIKVKAKPGVAPVP
ncbi:MAG TPA: ASPIC/UnbV domain-containing protein, partial [Terriglobales bacterium]|nr:ASPIC/UnbV domain-containing protein [Terriglobales bacterium]